MAKKYTSTAFLKLENSALYAIFAWSQKQAELIPAKSWLAVLEIFVHEHSIESAYQIFQKIRLAPISDREVAEVKQYENLLKQEPTIILLADNSITIFAQGFRSFIEKSGQYELVAVSRNNYQVLLQLFSEIKLADDVKSIENERDFRNLVEKLENIGLLSPATGCIDWGDLKKTVPICQAFGLTRGTPVDRYYLSKFISEIQPQVVGNILEIGGTPKDKDFYQLNSGSSYRILNLEPGAGVDITGDVHDVSIIKPNSIDSVIIFNVLEHCYAPWIAIENIHTWLKPGGKCFAMVPSAIRVHATPVDYWRPLPDAFAWLFRKFAQQKLYVYGNPITVIASYHGIAVEELTAEELDAFHPDYPVATCIVAEK